MARALLRFYEELNDFLPPARRKRDIEVSFQPPVPLRHLVEAQGVPHTEIELALLDGRSVDLEARVRDGARASLYPLFEALDVTPLLRIRPKARRDPRFLADAHLGRLARLLRLLGFDTRFANDPGDAALARSARDERRILLTRDRALLMRREVTHGCYIHPLKPREQAAYVLRRCDLYRLARPFDRCLECNGELRPIPRAAVAGRVPPGVWARHQDFLRCVACGRIYWQGSHYRRLRLLAERLLAGIDTAPEVA